MAKTEPLALHVTAPIKRSHVGREALAGLKAGRRVNVFHTQNGSTSLLFGLVPFLKETFAYSPFACCAFDNPVNAIHAGLDWSAHLNL